MASRNEASVLGPRPSTAVTARETTTALPCPAQSPHGTPVGIVLAGNPQTSKPRASSVLPGHISCLGWRAEADVSTTVLVFSGKRAALSTLAILHLHFLCGNRAVIGNVEEGALPVGSCDARLKPKKQEWHPASPPVSTI